MLWDTFTPNRFGSDLSVLNWITVWFVSRVKAFFWLSPLTGVRSNYRSSSWFKYSAKSIEKLYRYFLRGWGRVTERSHLEIKKVQQQYTKGRKWFIELLNDELDSILGFWRISLLSQRTQREVSHWILTYSSTPFYCSSFLFRLTEPKTQVFNNPGGW